MGSSVSKRSGYSRAQIGLHWLTLVLIGVQVLLGDGMETAWKAVQKGLPFEGISAPIHVISGITILALVAVRVVLRLTRGVPENTSDASPLFDRAARAMHFLLIGLLMLIPLLGISAWFFNVTWAAELHSAVFKLLFVAVILHAGAALFHQFYLKDGLIRRMIRPE